MNKITTEHVLGKTVPPIHPHTTKKQEIEDIKHKCGFVLWVFNGDRLLQKH